MGCVILLVSSQKETIMYFPISETVPKIYISVTYFKITIRQIWLFNQRDTGTSIYNTNELSEIS
jgi:hypothetical protein